MEIQLQTENPWGLVDRLKATINRMKRPSVNFDVHYWENEFDNVKCANVDISTHKIYRYETQKYQNTKALLKAIDEALEDGEVNPSESLFLQLAKAYANFGKEFHIHEFVGTNDKKISEKARQLWKKDDLKSIEYLRKCTNSSTETIYELLSKEMYDSRYGGFKLLLDRELSKIFLDSHEDSRLDLLMKYAERVYDQEYFDLNENERNTITDTIKLFWRSIPDNQRQHFHYTSVKRLNYLFQEENPTLTGFLDAGERESDTNPTRGGPETALKEISPQEKRTNYFGRLKELLPASWRM